MVSLFRVIQCTSLHPRLALLTGTLIKAADDLWHATLLIVMLMCCFASIATWRFGSQRPDFATFELSMQTQFMVPLPRFSAFLHIPASSVAFVSFFPLCGRSPFSSHSQSFAPLSDVHHHLFSWQM